MTATVGDNFYQSLTVEASESEYDQINSRNTSIQIKEASPQSEYDVIPTTFPDSKSVTTDNSLYATKGDTLKHPTIIRQDQHLQYYQLAPVPESIFTVQDTRSNDGGKCCKCSVNALLFILSVLTILLSIMAITLVFLIQFGVITAQVSTSSDRPLIAGVTISSRIVRTSTSVKTILPSPSSLPPSLSCDCPETVTPAPTTDFDKFHSNLSRILSGIEQLKRNENITSSEKIQLLSTYLSQIKTINNSLQQLRPAANTPKEPVVTGLNSTTDIDLVMNESCTFGSEIACIIQPNQGLTTCDTAPISFVDNGLVLVKFQCNVTSRFIVESDSVLHAGASREVQFTGSPSLENLQGASMLCRCYNFGTHAVTCGYTFTRCPIGASNVRTANIRVLQE